MSSRRVMMMLPVGLLLAACATGGQSDDQAQAQFKPADMSGDSSPAFSNGYAALKDGNNGAATQQFEVALRSSPSDPYENLDLGAAYQNTGLVERALPLYRETIQQGAGVYPADVTQAEVQGMPLDEIAKHNLALAGYDANGNLIQQTSTTTTVAAAAQWPMTYQVFFDFDKSELTPEARSILRQAAEHAKSGSSVRITLTGHTDTVGSAAYNMGLSDRRAQSAASEMIADGIPSPEIVTHGVGKSGLLVPTADGIREPRNRRVEIMEEMIPNS